MQDNNSTSSKPGLWPSALPDWPKMLGVFIIVSVATAIAIVWIDLPLAQFIAGHLNHGATQALIKQHVPDLLDFFVAAVSAASWIGYIALHRQRAGSRLVCTLQVVGTAVPFAYTAKDALKSIFGRVNTRYWLDHPNQFAFHWFEPSQHFFGFPSGHLAVCCALAFAVMHFYPRLRPWGWLAIALLSIALLVTEYHFLGDVFSGIYVGYLTFFAARILPGATPLRSS